MGLKQSFYDGGKRNRTCEICGAILPYSNRVRIAKCDQCAKKIAKQVEDEFRENKGHYLSEAILTTGNEKLIGSIQEGQKLLEESNVKTIKETDDGKSHDN